MKRTSLFSRLGAFALGMTLLTTCLLGGTLAKYATEVAGHAKGTAAAWSFTANAGEESTPLNLASTTYTNVADGKIAPGTSGSFNIVLDGSGSEVGIDYTIQIVPAGGSNIPANLTLTDENGDALTDNTIAGAIDYSTEADAMKKTVVVNWAWADGDATMTSGSAADNAYEGEDFTYDITITGEQQTPSAT